MTIEVTMTVNGKAVKATVDPRTLLVEFLREHLNLTGTHVGCDTGQCGACTIHLDGRAVKACMVLAAQASGAKITTIEGIATQRHAASDAGRVQGMPWTAVRLLHARHGDERDRPRHSRTGSSTRRPSAKASTATCAAARAITTSSRRCSRAPPR